MTSTGCKILLITNIPNPYRIPLFNELSCQLEVLGFELLVVFGAMGYERRKFSLDMSDCKFRYTVLPEKSIRYRDIEKISFIYSGLYSLIREENPDIIITNAFSIATLKLWFRSWFSGVPYIIWSGAIHGPGEPVSAPRKIQRRLMISRASGFISYGAMAKQYLVDLGAQEDQVSIGINTVDTEFFRTETERQRLGERPKGNIRQLLSVTYLTPRKRVENLLYIVREVIRTHVDVRLVVLGDGPELERLKCLAGEIGVSDYVNFEGFVHKADVPKYMAQASVFLFPTDFDIWGLVLVEAMAAGLPCIASVKAGATSDLIREGLTGASADFDDAVYVADKIKWLLDNPGLSDRIGAASARMIREDVNLAKSASGFVESIQKVTGI